MNTDLFAQMAEKILRRHERILGNVAIRQAVKIEGLKVDPQTYLVSFEGDKKVLVEKLILQYEKILGGVSIVLSKEAVKDIVPQVPPDQIPQLLL